MLKGVHKHAGLLRAGIASSGNDHRLGANEAPPAIISVFLGDMLSRILDDIEKSGKSNESGEAAVIRLGVAKLPEVMKDNTDRNRTSPFAFTGNKFEFRAVGSSASTAFPVTLLNAAVADGISEVTAALKAKMDDAEERSTRRSSRSLRDLIPQTKAVRFEGNNYSEEWVREAEKRGLPNLRKTPEALKQLVTPASKKMLVESGVFSEAELTSRFHVRLERYIKDLAIEVETLTQIVDTMILPAALMYHGKLAEGAAAAKAAGFAVDRRRRRAPSASRTSSTSSGSARSTSARRSPRPTRPRTDDAKATLARARSLDGDARSAPRLRRARGPSSPTTSGRCRSTARCCSSPEAGFSGARDYLGAP